MSPVISSFNYEAGASLILRAFPLETEMGEIRGRENEQDTFRYNFGYAGS